jgi:hypothetical protein
MKTIEQLTTLGLSGRGADMRLHGNRTATLRRSLIHYPQFCAAVREIADLHERWRSNANPGGMLMYGQSGSGKTTVLDYYVEQFPRKNKQGVIQIPVLKVLTPESPTVKSLAEQILIALGDPAAERGSAATKTRRIAHLFNKCSVEMLILDEFHHFYESHRVSEGRKVSDWLKNLLSDCKIPILLCGLPRSIAALNANIQLRRRFSAPHHLREFSFGTEDDQLEFRGLLKEMEAHLPVRARAPLSDPDIARRFFVASAGLIDYVVKIVDRYISQCDSRHLSLHELASAFRKEIWADVPDALNPFLAPASRLRLLTEPREPFDGWDNPARYTLSKRAAAVLGRSLDAEAAQ